MGKVKDSSTNWSTDDELQYETYGEAKVEINGWYTIAELKELIVQLEEAERRQKQAMKRLMGVNHV